MHEFFFGVYPYVCLTILMLGLLFRYLATPGEWNARSSNLFAKHSLATGSYLFHYAIILAFFGHVFGLLTPPWLMGALGISYHAHMVVAELFGRIIAPCVFTGLAILLWRRLARDNVRATTVPMDIVVILFIMFQALTGGYQDYAGRWDALEVVGSWARGIFACSPQPEVLAEMPLYIKIHIVCGLAIFAMIPFSRLIHFFSIPLAWFARPAIVYRRRYENL